MCTRCVSYTEVCLWIGMLSKPRKNTSFRDQPEMVPEDQELTYAENHNASGPPRCVHQAPALL